MTDLTDDLRRRMENMETMQADIRLIMRDTVANSGRLNEILVELKDDLKLFREDLLKLRETMRTVELDVANLKLGFTAIKWLGTTIGGAAIMLIIAYLFKVSA